MKFEHFIVNKPMDYDPAFIYWDEGHEAMLYKVFDRKNLLITDETGWFIHRNFELQPIYVTWIKLVHPTFYFCFCTKDIINWRGCQCGGV